MRKNVRIEIFHAKKYVSVMIKRGWFRIFQFDMSVDEKVVIHCPACGAFDLGLAVSVPLPIVTGIFVLLWFQSRLT